MSLSYLSYQHCQGDFGGIEHQLHVILTFHESAMSKRTQKYSCGVVCVIDLPGVSINVLYISLSSFKSNHKPALIYILYNTKSNGCVLGINPLCSPTEHLITFSSSVLIMANSLTSLNMSN